MLAVEEHSLNVEVYDVSLDGVQRRENVGISSMKSGENPDHRKPKVSWATMIDPGLGEPKVSPIPFAEQKGKFKVQISKL